MSSLITFRRGVYQGWRLSLMSAAGDRIIVMVETSQRGGQVVDGMAAFRPGVDGYDVVLAAYNGDAAEMEKALTWIVEASREALAVREDIMPEMRVLWQAIVDAADRSAADFYRRYPDGRVPAFEVVGYLLVSGAL